MRAPYGLEFIENCLACPHREERLFCNLPETSVKAWSTITSSASYPKGATLFVEGRPNRGGIHSMQRSSEAVDLIGGW
jgi:hypothetical protein